MTAFKDHFSTNSAGYAAHRPAYPAALVDFLADAAPRRFYDDVIGPYWPPERRHVEDGYRSLPFPFAPLQAPDLAIEVAWKLVGYVDTWSAVRGAERAVGRMPVEAFHADLAAAWGDPETARRVCWPLSLRVGRVG